MLVGGFPRGYCFLSLPAKFAGSATPHRQLKRYLEGLATRVGRSEAVVDCPRYYVATATFWAMIITHHTLLRIEQNVRSPKPVFLMLPSSTSSCRRFDSLPTASNVSHAV